MINIFKLQNPESLMCDVWEYSASHSYLTIRVHQNSPETIIWLGFSEVLFLSAPSKWVGCNFRLGTKSEIVDLMKSIGFGEDEIKNSPITTGHKLYTVKARNKWGRGNLEFEIKILAYQHHASEYML